MKSKIEVEWSKYDAIIKNIVFDIKEETKFNPDIHFVSIYRGSLGIGAHLSNIFDAKLSIVKYQSYDGGDKEVEIIHNDKLCTGEIVYILDDIYDTGETMSKVREKIFEICPFCKVYGITLIQNTKNSPSLPEWCKSYAKTGGEWVIFPWEH